MDSADSEVVRNALKAQGQRIQQQDEQLGALRREMREMSKKPDDILSAVGGQMNFLGEQLQRLQPPTPPVPSDDSGAAQTADCHSPVITSPAAPLQLSKLERFSGDSCNCRGFLTQCRLHFEFLPASFISDRAKVTFIVSLLTGRAQAWATAEFSRKSVVCDALALFTETFTQIFQTISPGREVPPRSPAGQMRRR